MDDCAVVYVRIVTANKNSLLNETSENFETQIEKLALENKGRSFPYQFISKNMFYAAFKGDNSPVSDLFAIQAMVYPNYLRISIVVGAFERALKKAPLYLQAILDRNERFCLGIAGKGFEQTIINTSLRVVCASMAKWRVNTLYTFLKIVQYGNDSMKIATELGISRRAVNKCIKQYELFYYENFFYSLQQEINKSLIT